jgi:hypothetical protein
MTGDPRRSAIVESMAGVLKPHGYSRRGTQFAAHRADMVHMVGLQSSQASTRDEIIVTVNLGAVSIPLADEMGEDTKWPSVWAGHWQCRLGFLAPEQQDKWWRVGSLTDAHSAADDIVRHLADYGLPALDRVGKSSELLAQWRAGRSLGITPGYCDRLGPKLAKLIGEPWR